MNPKTFLSPENRDKLIKAIRSAENETSGEIRLHIESRCKGDPLERAKAVFLKLKMDQTALRNGVIVYLALKDRKLAIWGDKGINEKVPENFWEDVKDIMVDHFKQNDFIGGLVKGIAMIGEKLKTYFPHRPDDVNELPDDISVGE